MTIIAINVEPIKDRAPIDAIANGDFVLVGDASDNGKVKPGIVGEIDFAPSKLAIADYDWATIPNKPVNLGADPSVIKAPSKPLTRLDGSPLEFADKWRDTSTFNDGIFNGTDWVSQEQAIYAVTARGSVAINTNYWCPIDLPLGEDNREKKFVIEFVNYTLTVVGTVNLGNHFLINGRIRQLATAEEVMPLESPSLIAARNSGKIISGLVLPAINPNTTSARASLGARISAVGFPGSLLSLSFTYFLRWIL